MNISNKYLALLFSRCGWIVLTLFSFLFLIGFLSVFFLGLLRFYGISIIVGYLMPNSLYTYILNIHMIWFGSVLWHINHCRLFNAKSSLYIYIKYTSWFGFMAYQSLWVI